MRVRPERACPVGAAARRGAGLPPPAGVADGTLGGRWLRRRRGNTITTPTSAAVPSATTTDQGAGTSRLANGSPAARPTSAIIRRRPTHAGSAMAAPSPAGRPGADEQAGAHGHDAGGHDRRDERDHDEIDRRRDERQPSERGNDDRQRRELRRQGHPQALGQPGRRPTPRPALDPLRRAVRPGDEAGRRQRRELEAGVADQARVRHEQRDRGPAQGGGRAAGPTGLPRPAGRRPP